MGQCCGWGASRERGKNDDVVLAMTEELEQLDRAQALLLADWSTRDTLLD